MIPNSKLNSNPNPFCTAQDGTVLMFPTFLQIILDLYLILYIRV